MRQNDNGDRGSDDTDKVIVTGTDTNVDTTTTSTDAHAPILTNSSLSVTLNGETRQEADEIFSDARDKKFTHVTDIDSVIPNDTGSKQPTDLSHADSPTADIQNVTSSGTAMVASMLDHSCEIKAQSSTIEQHGNMAHDSEDGVDLSRVIAEETGLNRIDGSSSYDADHSQDFKAESATTEESSNMVQSFETVNTTEADSSEVVVEESGVDDLKLLAESRSSKELKRSDNEDQLSRPDTMLSWSDPPRDSTAVSKIHCAVQFENSIIYDLDVE